MISDPPYSIQKAYFTRDKAFVVSEGSFEPTNNDGDDDYEGGRETFSKEDEEDDYDYLDFINPRGGSNTPRTPRSGDGDSSLTVSFLLQRLLDRLRDRISDM